MELCKLVGMCEPFAFVTIGDDAVPYEPRRAAIDLLKVKDWRGLVSFIENHALNRNFAWYVDDDSFGRYAEDVFGNAPDFDAGGMGRPLAELLTEPDMPDYIERSSELDDLVAVISIKELMHLRDSLRGMVLMAAVALSSGSEIPEAVQVSYTREEELGLGEVATASAGFTPGGLLDYQRAFSDDPCTTRTSTHDEWAIGNEFALKAESGRYSEAVRLACGNLAALAMRQLSRSRYDLKTLVVPDHIGEEATGYDFIPGKGFVDWGLKYISLPWWQPICDEVMAAIMKGRVSVCENCGIPFITERRGATTCSPSCRTSLCIKRKAKPAR